MSRLFIICFAIFCLAISQTKFLSQESLQASKSKGCTEYVVRNRGNPKLYLAETKSKYNTFGYLVKTSRYPQKWCFHDDLFITSVSSGLALDLAEANIPKNQIISWPKHEIDNAQNQKWTHTQYSDNDGSFKIQTQNIGLKKPYLTLNKKNGDVVLRPFDLDNDYQNWYLQPV